MRRPLSILGLALALTAFASKARALGDLTAYATSPDGTHTIVGWHYFEYGPTCPAFVGWDVYRRALDGCGAWTRVNPAIVPLAPVPTGNYQISDTPPLPNTMYQYEVRFVDASRHTPGCAGLCGICQVRAHASAPNLSAPVTRARIVDWGWTVALVPCANSCANHYYVTTEEMANELRPYAGTGESFLFWGTEVCGSIEGCALEVAHYQLAPCDITAARSMTWGRLKTIYR